MICYKCGEDAGNKEICPGCNADLHIFQRAIRISNEYYNDGLQKANVRNMSGAISSLKKCLKINKANTDARNLLGLVYYEIGETVEAIGEWVISTSLQAENNKASEYLKDIHTNRAQLDAVNQTIKKYNQAILYCKNGSRDLAMIQLKKVLTLNPNLVKGHQLLALLYLQEGQLERAKKTLRNAGKIDADNTTTLRYLKEVNRRLKEESKSKKPKPTEDLISYQSGNETIIMPKRFRESSLGATLLYVVAGIVVGVLVTYFLVIPGVKNKAAEESKKKLLDANDTISTDGQTITSLEKEIENLNGKIEGLTGDNEAIQKQMEAYDDLLAAFVKYSDGDVVALGDAIQGINDKYLSDDAKKDCDKLMSEIEDDYIKTLFNKGYSHYTNGNWEKGVDCLTKVVKLDKDYEDGSAVYCLAQCLRRNGDEKKAKEYFKYIIEKYPGTQKAKTAENYLKDAE